MSTPLNPSTFVLHTLGSLWEHLPVIVLGGLFFSLCCTPAFVFAVLGWVAPALMMVAFLAAPAWSALMYMQSSLLDGKAATVAEMWRALPRLWRPSFRLGVIGIVPCYLIYRYLPLLAEPETPWVAWVGFVLLLLAAAFVCALYLYAFPLTVLYELPLPVALRNSAILASRYAGNTMGLLSMGLLFALAVAYVSLALLFILPAVYAFFIVNHCRMVVGEDDRL